MMKRLTCLCLALLAALPALAAPPAGEAVLRERLAKALPGVELGGLRPAPVAGLYQLALGTDVIYVSADGRYMVLGDVVDLATKQNLSQRERGRLILAAIAGEPESRMLVIGPAKARRTLTVFTDVECPYCAKLHLEVPKLTAAGVKVRYLFYPRAGIGSSSYKKSVAVWCAEDRVAAIGIAKAGGPLPMKTCPNPVAEHLALGRRVGVRGTPMIVLDDGRVIPGYSPAERLLAALGLAPAKVSRR